MVKVLAGRIRTGFHRNSRFKMRFSGVAAVILASLAVATEPTAEVDVVIEAVEGYEKLSHLYRVSESIYSGGQPESEEAFAQLKRLGVRTIVNVDGAQPNLALAAQYGLSYVHIPIGYDAVPVDAAASMAKTLSTKAGPFYIHCHHGHHRGPAMAAIAVQLETGCDTNAALKVLHVTGTSADYAGLWRDVGAFQKASIEGMDPELFEAVPVGSFVSEMATIDRIWDRIQWCEVSGWTTPPDHPDVSPIHEALMLNERLRELVRLDATLEADLLAGLREAEESAKQLHVSLTNGDVAAANERFAELKKSCKDCHTKYRD